MPDFFQLEGERIQFDSTVQDTMKLLMLIGNAMVALFPDSKRRRKGLVSAVHAYHHVLISGRVLMTPSKSHGSLYDISIHCSNRPHEPS